MCVSVSVRACFCAQTELIARRPTSWSRKQKHTYLPKAVAEQVAEQTDQRFQIQIIPGRIGIFIPFLARVRANEPLVRALVGFIRLVHRNSELSCVLLRVFKRARSVAGHAAPSALILIDSGRRAALVTMAWRVPRQSVQPGAVAGQSGGFVRCCTELRHICGDLVIREPELMSAKSDVAKGVMTQQ